LKSIGEPTNTASLKGFIEIDDIENRVYVEELDDATRLRILIGSNG
jgi:hypothetical protein